MSRSARSAKEPSPFACQRHRAPSLRAAGLAGDVITALTGKPFYITSSRYRSMVTDYVTPMDKTYTVLGPPKIPLQQGVNETLTWLRTQPSFKPS